MKYTTDELEFAISQYVDGTLKPLEQAAVEEILASDQSAREMLAEYRRLNVALQTKLAQPRVDFDALAAQVSKSLANAEAPVAPSLRLPIRMRFLAIAASIVILVGLGALVLRSNHPAGKSEIAVKDPSSETGSVIVQGPSVELPAGAATVDVSIGAPPGVASAGTWQDQAIITRTPRVVIESSALPMQDTGTPY